MFSESVQSVFRLLMILLIFQSQNIHDCVGCHNKGEPKMIANYELESPTDIKQITFYVTLYRDEKGDVFPGETRRETTKFTIENPIVSQ